MLVALSVLVTATGYLIGIALIPRILLERRETGATLAWVLAILFFPYLGALLFWAIGTRRIRFRRRKRARAEAALAPGLATSTEVVRPFESAARAIDSSLLPEPARELAHLADRLGKPACSGNSAELLVDAEATFSRIDSAI